MSASTASEGGKKKKEGKVATCRYCDMTFRKLEHAQRHERTHTLDRPYVCDTCGKTFARQDTLHRHSRLHLRKDEDGPAGKAPRKRRLSNASPPAARPSKADSSESSSGSSTSPSTSSSGPLGIPVFSDGGISPHDTSVSSSSSALFPGLGLSMSLPVAPPSFPAYSQPEISAFPSIDPSFIPLPRRFSDAGYGATLAPHALGAGPASPATSALSGAGAAPSGATTVAGSATGSGRPALRPRAMTLAGLPESLGCFSLINSPVSSHGGNDDDDESASSSDGDEDGDSDIKVQGSSTTTTSEGGDNSNECDQSWAVDFGAPESHYPSPAFSSYSPSALHTDTLDNLKAILANDPVPSSAFDPNPSPPPTAQPHFDYETFAASIEGPAPGVKSASAIPTTLEELLNNTAHDLANPVMSSATAADAAAMAGRYPTPPSGSLGAELALPSSSSDALKALESAASFDLAAHLNSIISSDAEQQARADRAATAAIFASGYGVTNGSSATAGQQRQPSPKTMSSLSALGLQFGPAPTAAQQSQQQQRTADSNNLSLPLSSPSLSSSAQLAATYSLSATYSTTYPSLSLPVAGFDLPTSSSFKYDTSPLLSSSPLDGPSLSASSASDAAAAAASIHDLLTLAWERRQRRSTAASAAPAVKSPFAHPARSTPAFYIPASNSAQGSPSSSTGGLGKGW
ncbi:C2H2-type zinc finger protein [Rhodotorula paludigena]|uniref:C2H2-type zinc finger protein n=1 Tax=Rhodotorula paludigena TaxID=86838 RepID=UPI003181E2A8